MQQIIDVAIKYKYDQEEFFMVSNAICVLRRFGMSQRQIASATGISKSEVDRLSKLALIDGKLRKLKLNKWNYYKLLKLDKSEFKKQRIKLLKRG